MSSLAFCSKREQLALFCFQRFFHTENIVRNYGSEKEAQMRIYEASWDGAYEFRCEIDEDASEELASMTSNPSVKYCGKN